MTAVVKKVLLFCFSISVLMLLFGQQASAGQPNWWQGTPSFQKVNDIPEISTQDKYCIKTKIAVERVVRQIVTLVDEEHCMVPTSYGQISSDVKVLQPIGQSVAYPIVSGISNGLIPIPHMPGVLKNNTATFTHGSSMGLYKNFYSSLELKYVGGKHYTLTAEPDEYFRYPSGSRRLLNIYATLSFTQNGHALVVEDKLAGFIKINLGSLEVTPYYPPTIVTSSGSLLDSETAVHEGGATFIGYNMPRGWGDGKLAEIIDTNDCVVPPYVFGVPLKSYPCKHRNLLPEMMAAIPGLERIYNPMFLNNRTIKFEAQINVAGGTKFAEYTMTASGEKYRQLEYLALGDSFASGQGAGNYRTGTDTDRNRCHQSTLSYPYIFAKYFESSASVACSGARLHNIFLKNTTDKDIVSQLTDNQLPTETEKGIARIEHLPGYVEQIYFMESLPSTVTISIGGNDIKFAEMVAKCAYPQNTADGGKCYQSYEDRLEIVKLANGRLQRLRDTYKAILNGDPERKLYVIGYPQVAKSDGDCGANVKLERSELEGTEDLINYLNRVIKEAANEAGAYYVDTEDALYGFRLCETKTDNVAVNGVTIRFDQGKLLEATESFHPNARGHELLAAAIRGKTKNFTQPMPIPTPELASLPIDDNIDFLRNAPKTNRTVYDVRHEESPLYPRYKGDPQELVLEGKMQLLQFDHGFKAVLHSNPIQLGTFTTDSEGNLRANYVIPDSVEPGLHTLHLYGKDVFGNDIDIQQTLYVAASEQDIDGDGILNDRDVCVGDQDAADVDKDNIPDTCDPLIDDAPTVLPENQVSINSVLSTNSASGATVLAHAALPSSQQVLPSNISRLEETAAVSQNTINKPKVSATAIAGKSSHDTNKQWVVTALAGIGLFALVYICRRFIM